MNSSDRDGPTDAIRTDVPEDKPAFVERRRPGRLDYTNQALIALLRRPDGDVSQEDRTPATGVTIGLNGDMTALDYANCGINDVIKHSLKLHPQLLVDRLRSHACVHAEFADAYDDREVTRSELDLADRLHAFANAVELGDHTMPDELDVRHKAFSCAAWLQDLHPIMQNVIAERENARNTRRGRDD